MIETKLLKLISLLAIELENILVIFLYFGLAIGTMIIRILRATVRRVLFIPYIGEISNKAITKPSDALLELLGKSDQSGIPINIK